MKHSEFYEAVEATFGSALGRPYVSDLYLASLGATARDALSSGANPDAVWATLCEETGREDARWIHRVDPRERGRRSTRLVGVIDVRLIGRRRVDRQSNMCSI